MRRKTTTIILYARRAYPRRVPTDRRRPDDRALLTVGNLLLDQTVYINHAVGIARSVARHRWYIILRVGRQGGLADGQLRNVTAAPPPPPPPYSMR